MPDGYNFSEDLKIQIYNILKLCNFPEIFQPNLYTRSNEASVLYSGVIDKFQDVPEIIENLSKFMEKNVKIIINEYIRSRQYYLSRDLKPGISIDQFKSYLINKDIISRELIEYEI